MEIYIYIYKIDNVYMIIIDYMCMYIIYIEELENHDDIKSIRRTMKLLIKSSANRPMGHVPKCEITRWTFECGKCVENYDETWICLLGFTR